jgi:hypothetical protein
VSQSSHALICWVALLIPAWAAAPDDIPAQPVAQKGDLVFSDDFSSDQFGAGWTERIKSAGVEKGIMFGRQTTTAHGSVATAKLKLPDGNLIFECRVQFEHNATVAFSFDDMSFKGSVAGHIARVTLEERLVKLHDDRDGAMNRELADRRKSDNPETKAAAENTIREHTRMLPLTLETRRWYLVRIEIVGDQMRLMIDEKPVGWLRASGLAHDSKPDLKISVSGKQALFDDLKVWSANKAVSH